MKLRLNWRWAVWTVGIAVLALFALFPLRLAIAWSDLGSVGISARQVAGTIWYGRIGELHIRSQPLGTLEVAAEPSSLLLGNFTIRFERLDSPEGPLGGKLVSGWRRGIANTSGRIDVGQMFAPVPVGSLDLQDVTVLFRDGQCERASGRISPVVASPIPGVELSGLSGTVECDGERARVTLDSTTGAERIEFYIHEAGDYRAWMSVRSADPVVNAALATMGFRSSPEGMSLTVDGRF